jgi:type IX secretion system PorP/SprF family membrane protein
MKKIFFLLILSTTQLIGFCQQQPLSSLFDWNTHNLNAAYASLQDSSFARLSFRKQWAAFSESPTTLNASGFGQIGNKSGVSAMIMHDQMGGAFTSNLVSIAYSRRVRVTQDFNLGFGVAGIFNQYSFNADRVELLQQEDPSFLSNSRSNGVDANFGLMLQGRGFTFGIGGQQVFQSKLNNFNSTQEASNTLGRYYFLHGSYEWKLSENIKAVSSALVKTNGITPEQVDLQTVFKFNQLIGVGVNHRFDQGPALLLQISQDKLYFAYAYDIPSGALGEFNSGSHEIVLGYCIRGKNDLKDADQDGVPDKRDDCPNSKGAIENKGCPWPDTDSDGINDKDDACPLIAGSMENKGCPWPDTDGDGITDNQDQCPEKKGLISNLGCPSVDSDGDGVNDEFDTCPLTKGEESNDGCPIVSEVQQTAIERAIASLEFETGKAIILKSSYAALDILAMMLQEKPDWTILLEGHTDDVGDGLTNLRLSKERAESVAQYMINKGIQSNQIQVLFYGEAKPIADNISEEGRKQNRRVEMKFLFK